jgi:hypothetical protein
LYIARVMPKDINLDIFTASGIFKPTYGCWNEARKAGLDRAAVLRDLRGASL